MSNHHDAICTVHVDQI